MLCLAKELLVPIDSRRYFIIARIKSFRSLTQMVYTTFRRQMEREIPQRKRPAKGIAHENVNENYLEEVIIYLAPQHSIGSHAWFSLASAALAVSPTKTNSTELLQKELHAPLQTHLTNPSQQATIRKSPKKRPLKRHTIVSSSSSTESLTSDTKGTV